MEYNTMNLNSDQADILEMLSQKCDDATAMVESAIDNVSDLIALGESATELDEGVHEVKDKIGKAWKTVVEFFKKCIRYIKEKLQGKVHHLNLKFVKGGQNEDHKIEFYTKMKKFKTMEINKNDTIEAVIVPNVHAIIETLLKITKGEKINQKEIEKDTATLAIAHAIGTDKQLKAVLEKCIGTAIACGAANLSKETIASGEIYSVVREVTKVKIKYNEKAIDTIISGINTTYQKAIDAIYDISNKVVKSAKKAPSSKAYKYYVCAKNISASCLNVNTLIKVKE